MTNSISCPVCNNLCSTQAATCPKCGHPFSQKNTFSNKTKSLNIWKILTIVVGMIFGGLIIFAIYHQFVKTQSTDNVKSTPVVSPSVVSTPNPLGTLEIQSAIIYKVGGVQPVANTTFHLLDKSAEEIIQSAGIKPKSKEFQGLWNEMKRTGRQPEKLSALFWFNNALVYPEMFGDYLPKAITEIKKHAVKSINTDLQGKAKFEGLERKQYFLFGSTETRGGSSIWNLPIEINDEKKSIILDQNNALMVN